MMQRLVAIGGKVWERGEIRRVYFNYEELAGFYGLKHDGWKWTVDGEKVSNNSGHSFASTLRDAKFWYDLATGKFCSKGLSDAMATKIIERIEARLADLAHEPTAEKAEAASEKTAEVTITDDAQTSATAAGRTDLAIGEGGRMSTNRKPGRCCNCETWVEAGEGHLWKDPHAGWQVAHKDADLCRTLLAERHARLDLQASAYRHD